MERPAPVGRSVTPDAVQIPGLRAPLRRNRSRGPHRLRVADGRGPARVLAVLGRMESVAPYRSVASLLRQAEQAPAVAETGLSQLVQRDNADTDQLRARNALQSSCTGSTACGCHWARARAPTPAGPRRGWRKAHPTGRTVSESNRGPVGRPCPQCPRGRWVGFRLHR